MSTATAIPQTACPIFVRNLHESVDEKTLTEFIKQHCSEPILAVSIARTAGVSRTFGYVTFESKESANKAIAVINGKELRVLRIKDLPLNVTEQQLLDAFSKFGKIERIQISSSLHQTSSAAITFETAEAAKNASAEMNNFNFNGSIIKATVQSQLRATEFETSNKTVVVSFFPSSWTEKDLRAFFGDLKPTSINFAKSGPTRAYVNFATAEELKAAKNLNGSPCRNGSIRVEYYNRPDNRRQNNTQKQFNNRKAPQPTRHIEALRAAELTNAEEAIEELGTRIFEHIEKTEHRKLAGKITGMILESHARNHNEINELLKNDKIFDEINEAVSLLERK